MHEVNVTEDTGKLKALLRESADLMTKCAGMQEKMGTEAREKIGFNCDCERLHLDYDGISVFFSFH